VFLSVKGVEFVPWATVFCGHHIFLLLFVFFVFFFSSGVCLCS